MPLPLTGRASRASHLRLPADSVKFVGCLSWAWTPLQSLPDTRQPPDPPGKPGAPTTRRQWRDFLPWGLVPYSVFPTRGSGLEVGFASPDRLRLQVFSTSWRFDPPRACRPCFMPDPLLGFALQSLAPHVQPYAVTGTAPLLTSGPPEGTLTAEARRSRRYLGYAPAPDSGPL